MYLLNRYLKFTGIRPPVNNETPDSNWIKEKELVSLYIWVKNTDMEAPTGYDQFDYPLEQSVNSKAIVDLEESNALYVDTNPIMIGYSKDEL